MGTIHFHLEKEALRSKKSSLEQVDNVQFCNLYTNENWAQLVEVYGTFHSVAVDTN